MFQLAFSELGPFKIDYQQNSLFSMAAGLGVELIVQRFQMKIEFALCALASGICNLKGVAFLRPWPNRLFGGLLQAHEAVPEVPKCANRTFRALLEAAQLSDAGRNHFVCSFLSFFLCVCVCVLGGWRAKREGTYLFVPRPAGQTLFRELWGSTRNSGLAGD